MLCWGDAPHGFIVGLQAAAVSAWARCARARGASGRDHGAGTGGGGGLEGRYFKDYTTGEVVQRLIQETFPKALSEVSCSPVAPPAFDPQELESGKPFRYAAIVEVKPEIKIEDYAG